MAVRDIFKISRKTFFNPSAWIDYGALAHQNRVIWGILSGIVKRPVVGEPETFEQMAQKQGLTEKDIQDGIGTYRALAMVFLLLSIAAIVYGVYLVYRYTTLTGFLLSLAVSALFAAQAFKYDFWALQMRSRRLGLTFKDWKRNYFG